MEKKRKIVKPIKNELGDNNVLLVEIVSDEESSSVGSSTSVKKRRLTKTYLTYGDGLNAHGPPYECGVCSRNFTNLTYLQDHMNIHLGYKCKHCKETLLCSTPLSDHIIVNGDSFCLLKKWKEMERNRCFVFVNDTNPANNS